MHKGMIDRLAKEAGYSISERMSFESHDSCAERFVGLIAEEIARICDQQQELGGYAATCAEVIRDAYRLTPA